MSKLYIYLFFLGIGFSSFVNTETGWAFDQSTSQAFFMFQTVQIDGGVVIGNGDSAQDCLSDCEGTSSTCYCCENPYSCDVLGAFVGPDSDADGVPDTCIGWIYATSER